MSTFGMRDWHVTSDIERLCGMDTRLRRECPLTELGDAAHPCGQQGLLDGPQLRLAEHGELSRLAGPLWVSVQVQALWKAQHT